jgi:hypothetical protein
VPLPPTGQQRVNSKSASFQLRSRSDSRFYRPFRFDFTRELVSRATLTWLGSQVRSLSCPSLDSADPFELLEIHGRAWHPDIVSELACVHPSIFEHAEIDRRTEQSLRCVGAEAPFNVWSAWMRLIFRVSSIAGLCSSVSGPRSRVRARFSRVHLLRNGRRRERPQAAFLSLRMTMKNSEGEGETRESPPRYHLSTPLERLSNGPGNVNSDRDALISIASSSVPGGA